MIERYLFVEALMSSGSSGIFPGMWIADSDPKYLNALVFLSHLSLYWFFDWYLLFSMIVGDGGPLDLCLLGRLPLLPRIDVLTWMLAVLVRFFPMAIFHFPYQLRYDSILSSFAATARADLPLYWGMWAHSKWDGAMSDLSSTKLNSCLPVTLSGTSPSQRHIAVR